MNDIAKQTEAIQLSIYCNIICQLLKSHKNLSICKILVFSYLIKQNKFLGKSIYTAKNKQDVVLKGLSLLSGDFEWFCNSIPYIIKALHILINKGIVSLDSEILALNSDELEFEIVYPENRFIKNVIEESKSMTDRQFMKEVTYNV